MKRTNLVLDEQLLEEALRVSGQRTYSATVMLSLRELVRRSRAGRIAELRGSGLWEGDLSDMRSDAPRQPKRKTASRAAR
jgi:Arc/MetJ family transcription regulator